MKIQDVVLVQTVCKDPGHMHEAEIQNMASMHINNRLVEVTQDGEHFNVRIDGDETQTRFMLTAEQASAYIEKEVGP